jgi:hypothetical protein
MLATSSAVAEILGRNPDKHPRSEIEPTPLQDQMTALLQTAGCLPQMQTELHRQLEPSPTANEALQNAYDAVKDDLCLNPNRSQATVISLMTAWVPALKSAGVQIVDSKGHTDSGKPSKKSKA